MKCNEKFLELVPQGVIEETTADDVPGVFQGALEAGWVRDPQGAWFLRLFDRGYHGDRNSFPDLTSLEASVNGRAIPDLDLPEKSERRIEILARRGYSFACQALHGLARIDGSPAAMAVVTISPALYDETVVTGSVTFCSFRAGERPYVRDISRIAHAGVLVIDSVDCIEPLPQRRSG